MTILTFFSLFILNIFIRLLIPLTLLRSLIKISSKVLIKWLGVLHLDPLRIFHSIHVYCLSSLIVSTLALIFWLHVGATLMVGSVFLFQNFGKMVWTAICCSVNGDGMVVLVLVRGFKRLYTLYAFVSPFIPLHVFHVKAGGYIMSFISEVVGRCGYKNLIFRVFIPFMAFCVLCTPFILFVPIMPFMSKVVGIPRCNLCTFVPFAHFTSFTLCTLCTLYTQPSCQLCPAFASSLCPSRHLHPTSQLGKLSLPDISINVRFSIFGTELTDLLLWYIVIYPSVDCVMTSANYTILQLILELEDFLQKYPKLFER